MDRLTWSGITALCVASSGKMLELSSQLWQKNINDLCLNPMAFSDINVLLQQYYNQPTKAEAENTNRHNWCYINAVGEITCYKNHLQTIPGSADNNFS